MSGTVGLGRRHLGALAAIGCATLAAHAAGLGGGFVFDARGLVLENPMLRAATPENLRFVLTHDYWEPLATNGLYRPLTTLSFLLDYAVVGHGDRPVGYLVENLLLHALNAVLVYALVFHLVRRSWPAAVAGALFGVHPVTTEVVANIVGRADLLATLGVLGGVLCWARGVRVRGWARVGWGTGLAVASALAFFSKESGLVLVGALLLLDLARPPVRLRVEHLVVGAVLVAYLVARWQVARRGLPPEELLALDNPLVETGWWTGRLTAAWVLVRELALVLWPATLSADYSFAQVPLVGWPPRTATDVAALVALAALAVLPWVLWRERRRAPALFFLAAFASVALLPTSNLFYTIGSIMAERFLYLPLVGLAGVAALAAERAPIPRPALRVAVGAVLAALTVRTAVRARDWRDDRTLWTATVRAAPASAKARKSYAGVLFAADPGRRELSRVITEAEQAVAIRPDYQGALADLGGYYLVQGDLAGGSAPADGQRWFAQAITVLERARTMDEQSAARFRTRMLGRGHTPDTIPDVGDPTLYNNLALAYLGSNRLDDALGAYDTLRRLQPARANHYIDRSAVLLRLGRSEDAAVALFQAVAIAPDQQAAALRLVDVYRTFYPNGGAVVTAAPNQIQINLDDPAVRRHRCRAWRELVDVFSGAQLRAAAAHARQEAAGACASEDDTD